MTIHLHLASFYATKYFWKKLATGRGILIEQIFKLRGPGPPGRLCTPIVDCFHDKTIISKKNIRLDCYLLLVKLIKNNLPRFQLMTEDSI